MQEFDLTQDGKHYRISRSSDKSPFIGLTMIDDPQTARSTLVRISFPVSVWEWVAKSLASLVPPSPEHTNVQLLNAYADLTSRMIAASGALRQSTFEIEAQALWERWHPQPSGGSSS
jgi:hypothetical protein